MPSLDHPSSSAVQARAEEAIVQAAADVLGVELVRDRRVTSIPIGDDAHVEVDAATEDRSTVVEAYARQGRLKGAQLKKIAQDVLKLALIKMDCAPVKTRTVIAFASEDARRSIAGWVLEAAKRFDVTLLTVEIPSELRAEIVGAQSRQVMVNVDQFADDVVLDG